MAQTTTIAHRTRTRNDSPVGTFEDMESQPRQKRNCVRGTVDLTVLGISSGLALGEVRCALLRYYQTSREEPLRMALLHVCLRSWIASGIC